MKARLAKGIFAFLGLTLLGTVTLAQPASPLPPRSIARMGATGLRHGSPIMCLAYSPDGLTLAAGGGNDPLRLWDPKTGAVVREINEPMVQTIAFTASGENMVFAGLQKTVHIWNFLLKKEVGKLEGHRASIKAVAISPDTEFIASGSQDGAIFLWEWGNKRKQAEMNGHTDEVTALVYTPDNNWLISASSDHTIQFWGTETLQSKRKLDAGCGVLALAVSEDSKTLYSAGDDHLIRRWDIETGKHTGVFRGHQGIILSLLLRGDNLVSGSLDQTIRFWDTKTLRVVRSVPCLAGECDALALTRTGDFVAFGGSNNSIRIFDAMSLKGVAPAAGPQAGWATLLGFPGDRLLAATQTGQIFLWNTLTAQVERTWDSKPSGEFILARSADGTTLALASNGVRLFDVAKGSEIMSLTAGVSDPVMALAFAPDGGTLALAHHSGRIDLWDSREKKRLHSFQYDGPLHALAWSPNGQQLAAGGWAKITVWNPRTRKLIKSVDVHEGPAPVFPLISLLVFSPDSSKLAAGGFDASVRIYAADAETPASDKRPILCEGHRSMPSALAFSADGRTLLSGSFDRTVRLWEVFSGKQIAQFKGHIGPVTGVVFTPDGRSASSAGTDGVIYRWDVPGFLKQGTLPALTLAPEELQKAWTTLASEDTPRGHETMWQCIASAEQSLPFLNQPGRIYLLEPDHVQKLFKDLDSNNFATRTAAMKELNGYGRWMEGRYNAAIANPPSLEYKRRVEKLKDELNTTKSLSLNQERLRMHRFMILCEQVGNSEAIDALRKLAAKGPEEEFRDEAKASLARLAKKK